MNLLSAFVANVFFAAAGLQSADGPAMESFLTSDSEVNVRIPEPSTLALGGLGLGGIAAMQRRKAMFTADRSE